MPPKNKEAYNEYMRTYVGARYHRLRNEWIAKMGGKCAECGASEGLQFDHIDKAKKSFAIGDLWSLSSEKIELELKKCQLLCPDCHIEKTRSERLPWKHGTWYSAFKKKCSCEVCIEFRTHYNAMRRLKRRNRGDGTRTHIA